MPETLPQIRPSFNGSLHIETRCEQLSADAGALVQREILERTGIIAWLTDRPHDPRDPSSTRLSMADLLRPRLLLLEQGLARPVRRRPSAPGPELAGGSRTRRGAGALEEGQDMASQSTLSRLLDTLSLEENLPVLHQAVTELACRRTEILEGLRRKGVKKQKRRRKKTMVLGPARRGALSGGPLPGKPGAGDDIAGGGPLSRASVRFDDGADGRGDSGPGLLEGLDSRSVVRPRSCWRSTENGGRRKFTWGSCE